VRKSEQDQDREPDRARLEAGLDELRRQAPGPAEGVFGPSSVAWRVYRENALFLGGLRALLMQIAHPAVAAGVASHSSFRVDPVGRSLRTFGLVHEVTFGDLDGALGAARQIFARHSVVRGKILDDPQGARYRANDPKLLYWVLATLLDSGRIAYRAFVGPIDAEQERRLHGEERLLALLFGIPDETLPPDLEAFQRYMTGMIEGEGLAVGPTARELCAALLARLPGPRAVREGTLHLTVSLLPERLRRAFGLSLTAAELDRARRWQDQLRRWYGRLPESVRYLPAYHRAMVRLGQAHQQPVPLSSRIGARVGPFVPMALRLAGIEGKHR